MCLLCGPQLKKKLANFFLSLVTSRLKKLFRKDNHFQQATIIPNPNEFFSQMRNVLKNESGGVFSLISIPELLSLRVQTLYLLLEKQSSGR